jgi:hypothetical protein
MMNLHQDFGGSPVLFIRFNPDEYLDHLNVKQQPSGMKRLRLLVEVLNGIQNKIQLENEWTEPLNVIYLYYDGFDGKKVEMTQIHLLESTFSSQEIY